MAGGFVDVGFVGYVFEVSVAIDCDKEYFLRGASRAGRTSPERLSRRRSALRRDQARLQYRSRHNWRPSNRDGHRGRNPQKRNRVPQALPVPATPAFSPTSLNAPLIVVIEAIFSVVGNVQILIAVVVVVADANALSPTGGGEPSFHGHIGEGAVVIIVVEVIGGSACRRKAFERRAVHDENVGPAVVVVIKDGYAGAGSFDDVFLGVDSAENICQMSPAFSAMSSKSATRGADAISQEGGLRNALTARTTRRINPRKPRMLEAGKRILAPYYKPHGWRRGPEAPDVVA